MERIDKIISNQTGYTRKKVKEMIRKKKITLNGEIISNFALKVNEEQDEIKLNGKKINLKRHIYLMLNKPKGYISATEDKTMKTVLDLLPIEYLQRNLFPAGRLDKNTTGLMLITNDGDFAHNILSPKKHVTKTYNVTIDIPITETMVTEFKNGVQLNDVKCKPAFLKITGLNTGIVTITEGKYHQIKRMFGCFGAKVTELQRIAIGNFKLPSDLKTGESREFTEIELKKIKENFKENS